MPLKVRSTLPGVPPLPSGTRPVGAVESSSPTPDSKDREDRSTSVAVSSLQATLAEVIADQSASMETNAALKKGQEDLRAQLGGVQSMLSSLLAKLSEARDTPPHLDLPRSPRIPVDRRQDTPEFVSHSSVRDQPRVCFEPGLAVSNPKDRLKAREPDPFDGSDNTDVKRFLTQACMYMKLQPQHFQVHSQRVL
jgi:hypothetical protein